MGAEFKTSTILREQVGLNHRKLPKDFVFMAKGLNSYIRKSYKEDCLLESGCRYCGLKEGIFQIDHIIPPQFGGLPERNNFCKACVWCNASKGDRTLNNWLDHIESKRDILFNKLYSYSGRLRSFNRRHKKLDDWLHEKLISGMKEHSRLCAIVGNLKFMING